MVQEVAQLLTRCQWEQALQILAGTWLCRVAVTTPQVCSPRQAGLAATEPGWHPCVCRKNFPLGKAVCIFALIRLQRNAKGAREMKHILSQPNGQINTGKKARISDQMNSDQNSGFKMEIERVLKSWMASQHVQREQIHSSKLCPAATAPVRVLEQLPPLQGEKGCEGTGLPPPPASPMFKLVFYLFREVHVLCGKIFNNFW